MEKGEGSMKNWEMEQGAKEIIRDREDKSKRSSEQREIKREQ